MGVFLREGKGMIFFIYNNLISGTGFAKEIHEEAGMIHKSQKALGKHFQALGLSGVLCSWATLAFIWLGLSRASTVGFCVTAALFGLALVAGRE